MRPLVRLVFGVLVGLFALLLCASAATTAVDATAYAYDAPAVARDDLHSIDGVEASSAQLRDSREGSASPPAEARGTSTTYITLENATNTAGTGGIGPVLKGQAGVNQVAADIEASGGKVLGREITVDAGGARTRPDLFVEDACGNRCFVEVKNGPTAKMTSNQKVAFPAIQSQGGVPVGANAAAAGLTPGVPIGPTPVWVVHVS